MAESPTFTAPGTSANGLNGLGAYSAPVPADLHHGGVIDQRVLARAAATPADIAEATTDPAWHRQPAVRN